MRALLAVLNILAAITLGLSACTSAQTIAPTGPMVTREDGTQADLLLQARSSLDAKRNAESLALVDKVIAHYELQYQSEKRRIYCARSQTEMLLYMLSAVSEKTDAIAIGPTWAAAYYMRAFTLVELGRVADARIALERARALSPSNSQILSELGYSYQLEGDFTKALATYVEAEKAAEFSPDNEKVAELTRALRGQGYVLTEQGRLDDSEAKYKRCLELDPNDENAKRELAYIAKMRSSQSGGGGA